MVQFALYCWPAATVCVRNAGATKATQPLWTFVSITHRLGEVSTRRRVAVILAQIFSR